jgi:dihydroorotase
MYFPLKKLILTAVVPVLTVLATIIQSSPAYGQKIDILIKNGHVVDAKNGINAPMDVAITDGKIFKVSANIPEQDAKKVIDAAGLYVSPGLINIHTHVFVGSNPGFADGTSSQLPDAFAIRSGITTVVDAGTSGWKNFPLFKSQVIDKSVTRVLAFLNIFETGFSAGSAIEPNMNSLDVEKTVDAIKTYPETIVGTRIGHYSGSDWTPFDRAVEAAEVAKVPLLVECHLPQYSLEDQLQRMRPGDIITHAYENVDERMTVVDEQGKLRLMVREAQERGILFDVGHGGAGFWFNQAIPAVQQGLLPNSFGTDEHRTSMNSGMKNMLNVMSKFLTIGMSIEDILARATWNAAKSIKREDLGNLSEGSEADIAILSIVDGDFGFVDSGNNRISGDRKFEAEMTIRAGKIVWDLNGLGAKEFKY